MKIRTRRLQFLLCILFFCVLRSVPQDHLLSTCAPTHIRFTARRFSAGTIGEPVPDLTRDQLTVWLGNHRATVLSLVNSSPTKGVEVYTNILIVVPPFSNVDESSVDLMMNVIAKAENFRIRLAVLSADGRVSNFTSDLTAIHSKMIQAISLRMHYQSRAKWPVYEEAAFMRLRKLSGRHVIAVLRDPSNPFHSKVKKSFDDDHTLDTLALFDASQVYRMVQPSSLDLAIPMGDASTEHLDIGPDNHTAYQLEQMSGAEQDQDRLWAQLNPENVPNGGRNEPSVQAMITDILQDAGGSYDSIVLGLPPCQIGKIYPANVSPTVPNIRIFGPTQVQIIPATIPAS